MSVQEVWFAQSLYSNANSNDENLTCTSVHDSHLRQNMQGLNQNIIHYVDMMLFLFLQSLHPLFSTCTHTHTWTHTHMHARTNGSFLQVMWRLCWSLSLGYAVTHPVWLAGPCSVPGASRGFTAHLCVEQDLSCPQCQFSMLSLPPGGLEQQC